MAKIELEPRVKAKMIEQLKEYLDQELNTQIGTFEGEFFLDFISENFSAAFYNQGLADAQQVMMQKIDTINEDIYGLEKLDNS
ncbi:DUF2164 domain-containing protein [Marinomonas dokdonensis]|uniref:DUF2164 domain-containing protein n=1 Tax=Marinomonas dokdonensis TaxID=328224 RepID=UPI003281A5FF